MSLGVCIERYAAADTLEQNVVGICERGRVYIEVIYTFGKP